MKEYAVGMYPTSNGLGLTRSIDYPQPCWNAGFSNRLVGFRYGNVVDSQTCLIEQGERLVDDSAPLCACSSLVAGCEWAWPASALSQHDAMHPDAVCLTQLCSREFKPVMGRRRTLSDDIRMHPYGRRFSDYSTWPELRHCATGYDLSCALDRVKVLLELIISQYQQLCTMGTVKKYRGTNTTELL